MSSTTNVVLTVGHGRSVAGELLAELLWRESLRGVSVRGVIAVRAWQVKRIRALLRQRGWRWLRRSVAGVWAGTAPTSASIEAMRPLKELLRRHSMAPVGLRRWCRSRRVPLLWVDNLNAPKACRFLESCHADVVVYSGGGILKRHFLQSAGVVINAHAGPLPAVRGMTAAEWSLMLGEAPEVSVHVVDEGVDTGAVLMRQRYDRSQVATVETLRELAVATGISQLVACVLQRQWESLEGRADHDDGPGVARQCFVMAPVLLDIVERRLRGGA